MNIIKPYSFYIEVRVKKIHHVSLFFPEWEIDIRRELINKLINDK